MRDILPKKGLSPSSITWYRPTGGDAVRLEGNCRPGAK